MRGVQIAVLVLLVALLGGTTVVMAAGSPAADESRITDRQIAEMSAEAAAEQAPVTAMQGFTLPLWFEVLLFAGLGVAASILLSRRKTDDSAYSQVSLTNR